MASHAAFSSTQWSVILAAAGPDSEHRRESLAAMCEVYWYPLYSFARRMGHDAPDAEDLTQSFLADLIEGRKLESVSPEFGRFRTFLRTGLKRFSINEWRASQAQKRGGGAVHLSLDFESAEGRYRVEPGHELTPERAFDRQWALIILQRAMVRLEAEQAEAGKAERFAQLKPMLEGDASGASYDQLAASLGMRPGALRIAVHRLRQRYAQLVRVGVTSTLGDVDGLDEEINWLFDALKA